MTKILVDSSVWIQFLRKKTPELDLISQMLLEDRLVTCGLIAMEVCCGASSEKEYAILKEKFLLLEKFDITNDDFLEAAHLGFYLRKKGMTAQNTDLLIAHLAMKHKTPLLHHDKDFDEIAKQTNLQAFRA